MEEIFFFQYHMHMSKQDCMTIPIHERKFLLQCFLRQKEKEAQAIDKAKRQRH